MAYISEIAFLVGGAPITLGGSCSSFTKQNMNDGNSGKFIFPIHARTDITSEGITGFDFTQDNDAAKRGFTKIGQDLNEGSATGSRSNFLWFTKDSGYGSPITQVDFRAFDTEQTGDMIDHFKKYPANLNCDSGKGGKFIYLLYI